MRIVSGVICAWRPVATVEKAIGSMHGFWPFVFYESDSPKPVTGIQRVFRRPSAMASRTDGITIGPAGQFGNFQNWIQSARDLLELDKSAQAILIAEDDALFAPGIRELLERDLWPSDDCGLVSLYCPNVTEYLSRGYGLFRTNRAGLLGAVAMVFPRNVLEAIVYDESVATWRSDDRRFKPWTRKDVDEWIGITLKKHGYSAWHYSPSLVLHFSPSANKDNSSLGHGVAKGSRQCRQWVGHTPHDLLKAFPHDSRLSSHSVRVFRD